jgi:PPOX class probable FMN-dependent enzyme
MSQISSVEELRAIYREPNERAAEKEIDYLDPHCRRFIELSPFMLLATQGADGRGDVSPKGDAPGFVQVVDDHTLVIPDRRGNNRIDGLQNILANPSVGLIFLVPGVGETLRINGRAEIRDDADLLARFEINGKLPATVTVVSVQEAFLHCAKSIMRAKLWQEDYRVKRSELPSIGQMIHDQRGGVGAAESQAEMEALYENSMY